MPSVAKWEKTADKESSTKTNHGNVISAREGNNLEAHTLRVQGSDESRLKAESSQGRSKAVDHLLPAEMRGRVHPLADDPRVAAAAGRHRLIVIGVPYDEDEEDWYRRSTPRQFTVSEPEPGEPILHLADGRPIYRRRWPMGFRP